MDCIWEVRCGVTPRLTVAALFLCAALSIACTLIRGAPRGFVDIPLINAAAIASPFIFLCACILTFLRPRLGYGLGLLAGLIALAWLVETELSVYVSCRIFLNYEARGYDFPTLKILSVALTSTATACSTLRFLPVRVRLSQRVWPALAVGFVGLAGGSCTLWRRTGDLL